MDNPDLKLIQDFIRMKFKRTLASKAIKRYIREKFSAVLAKKRLSILNQSRLQEEATLDCTEFTLTNDSLLEKRICELSTNSSILNDLQKFEEIQNKYEHRDEAYLPKRASNKNTKSSLLNRVNVSYRNSVYLNEQQRRIDEAFQVILVNAKAKLIQRSFNKLLMAFIKKNKELYQMRMILRIQIAFRFYLNKLSVEKKKTDLKKENKVIALQKAVKGFLAKRKQSCIVSLERLKLKNKVKIIQRKFRETISTKQICGITKADFLNNTKTKSSLCDESNAHLNSLCNAVQETLYYLDNHNCNELTLRAEQAEYDQSKENEIQNFCTLGIYDIYGTDGVIDPVLEIDCQPDQNSFDDHEHLIEKSPNFGDNNSNLRSIEYDTISVDHGLKRSDDSKRRNSDLEHNIRSIENKEDCRCKLKEHHSGGQNVGLKQIKSHGALKKSLDERLKITKSAKLVSNSNKNNCIVKKLDFKEENLKPKKVMTHKSMNSFELLRLECTKSSNYGSNSDLQKHQQKKPQTMKNDTKKMGQSSITPKFDDDIRGMNSKMSHVTNRSLTQTQLEVISEHCGNSSIRRLNPKSFYIPLSSNIIKEEKANDFTGNICNSGRSVINLKKSPRVLDLKFKKCSSLRSLGSFGRSPSLTKNQESNMESLTDRPTSNKPFQKCNSISNSFRFSSNVDNSCNMSSMMNMSIRTSKSRDTKNDNNHSRVKETSTDKIKYGFSASNKLNRMITLDKINPHDQGEPAHYLNCEKCFKKHSKYFKQPCDPALTANNQNKIGFKSSKALNHIVKPAICNTEVKDYPKLLRNSTTIDVTAASKCNNTTKNTITLGKKCSDTGKSTKLNSETKMNQFKRKSTQPSTNPKSANKSMVINIANFKLSIGKLLRIKMANEERNLTSYFTGWRNSELSI